MVSWSYPKPSMSSAHWEWWILRKQEESQFSKRKKPGDRVHSAECRAAQFSDWLNEKQDDRGSHCEGVKRMLVVFLSRMIGCREPQCRQPSRNSQKCARDPSKICNLQRNLPYLPQPKIGPVIYIILYLSRVLYATLWQGKFAQLIPHLSKHFRIDTWREEL